MSSESELPDWNDPRIILFAFYGSVVVILAFCSCIHFSGWKCLVRRGRTEGDDEETEFDGRLYELIPKPTRLLMDYHRHNIIRSSLEDFSLVSSSLGKRCRFKLHVILTNTLLQPLIGNNWRCM